MTVKLNPYLSFKDTAREAMDLYQSVFGGELTRSTFGEYGLSDDPADKDKIMHSQLMTPLGVPLMAADTPPGMEHTPGTSYSVSLSGGPEDEEQLRGYWDKLCEGGTVAVPLEKAPWGDSFGMCVDRYGVSWMVNIAGAAG
jgi:PhnB protein